MRKIKVLLVGQPNVGKSSLLNALVGPKVTVSNYPGTTVEVTRATKRIGDVLLEFMDTPGIYSISDRTEEEKVTEKYLFEEDADKIVLVVDSTALERGLYIALQILESGKPLIIALNFIEEARKKGISINHKRLEKILGVPVVPINPINGMGIDYLISTIIDSKKRRGFLVKYDDHIEKAIKETSSNLVGSDLPKRFVSLRILEGDEDFYKYLKRSDVVEKIKKSLSHHPRISEDISITRYGTASFISQKVTKIMPMSDVVEMEDKVDRILLNKVYGPLITILFFSLMFGVLLYLGNLIQKILFEITSNFVGLSVSHGFVETVLSRGIIGLVAGISIALPYVFLFYFIFGMMEDVGLLPRFIVNIGRFLKRFGLPEKSFIPLSLGLGCTVPAMVSTRILSNKKERLYTASLLSFVPCSSRTAIIMGIVGFYGGIKLAILVFLTMMFAGILWAMMFKKLVKIENTPLILELPPYRRPVAKNVLIKSWLRMKDFVYVVIPLLVMGGILYGALDYFDVTWTVVNPLSPIMHWLGLPKQVIIPLLFGFLQKDLTGAMLISVLGRNITSILSPIQIYVFGVAASIGVPCVNAFGIMSREFGLKKATILTISTVLYGLIFSGLLYRVAMVLF